MRVKTVILALLLLLAFAACTASGSVEDDAPTASDSISDDPTAETGDDAQIYAAAIRQIYTVDHSFGQAPGWPLVYVVSVTEDSAMIDAPGAPSQTLPVETQEAITAELAGEPFELIWITAFDDAPIDPANGQIAGGDGIIISLGNIHPQEDGTVQLPFFMTCGGLCGIGKTYVLQRAGGEWAVSGSVGPEIMS
ncbi:MAG: hypothetical protein GWP61_23330 [Chloroflexi bacterium]|jgi:hypothetical protein|nr:hypothetical protein [Chloroflexota bacterium]